MSEKTRNITVGLTALLAVAGLAFMMVLFGYVPGWLERGYDVRVKFDNSSGVTEGARVTLSGVDIGRVRKVELLAPPERGVMFTMRINDVPLLEGVKVVVDKPFVGGIVSVAMETPDLAPGTEPKLLPTDGSAMITGSSSSLAGELASSLQGAMAEPLKKFDKLSTQFEALSSEWTQVGKNVNLLTEPRTLDDVKSKGKPANVSTMIALASQRLDELKAVLANIETWTGDEQLRADFKRTLANAAEAADKLKAGISKFEGLADSSKENMDRLAKRYIAVADDLSAAIGSMKKTLDAAREGDGTLGKFVKDPSLYNNLNDAVTRMNQAMVEVKLLVEKWKKEGLPVQF